MDNQEVGRYQVSITSDKERIYVMRIDTRTGEIEYTQLAKHNITPLNYKTLFKA